jgi:hypothetical protein
MAWGKMIPCFIKELAKKGRIMGCVYMLTSAFL